MHRLPDGSTALGSKNGGYEPAALVAGHDQAKRYLVTTDPAYAAVLSPQSVATLAVQGGVMTARDRAAFERRSQFADLLTLRRADDRAKDPTATVTDLGKWRVPTGSAVALLLWRLI